MNVILYDSPAIWQQLHPLTLTRPISEIRCGILTISEKWNHILSTQVSYVSQEYLAKKYLLNVDDHDNLIIASHILPDSHFIEAVTSLKVSQALVFKNEILACRMGAKQSLSYVIHGNLEMAEKVHYDKEINSVNFPWDIFQLNGREIENDFNLLTQGRKSQEISVTNRILKPENIFLEEGVQMEFATINASTGKVYLGKNVVVMENTSIRGSFAAGEGAEIKMAAKIYGPTTIGPFSKVGGEINNSVVFGYSNKAHDGFLGNSVIGEWCNLGADTNNSNLKNDYSYVKLWSFKDKRFVNTGLQFCGLMMGDHSKCGINTMFNTGTVVGVSSNIFGDGFPRNYIPSFSWGGAAGFTQYNFEKAMKVAQLVMQRRNVHLTEVDIQILKTIFNQEERNP